MKPKSIAARVSLSLCLLAAACGGADAGAKLNLTNPVMITDNDRKLAKVEMMTYCATCHGLTGKGDGLAGKALDPKPRNWTDPEWQKSVDDDHIFKVISKGGASVGLSPVMIASPTYKDKPAVVAALVEIVRSFGAKNTGK